MTPLHALARRLWPLVDWRRHAVLEARGRRGAAAMLDESMRRTVATLRWEPEGDHLEKIEPELMYRFCDLLTNDEAELREWL